MQKLLTMLFAIGPILFGLGIFAPVFAALVEAGGIALPLNISPIVAGLGIGLVLGAIASMRGRWI